MRLGAGRNEAGEQQLQCTQRDGHRRWSQGSESSTDSSVQARVGEMDGAPGVERGNTRDVGSISRGPGETEYEVLLQEDMCKHTQLETEEQWSRRYCLQAKL